MLIKLARIPHCRGECDLIEYFLIHEEWCYFMYVESVIILRIRAALSMMIDSSSDFLVILCKLWVNIYGKLLDVPKYIERILRF